MPSKLARLERLLSVMDRGREGREGQEGRRARTQSSADRRSGGPKGAQVRDAHYSDAVSEGKAGKAADVEELERSN